MWTVKDDTALLTLAKELCGFFNCVCVCGGVCVWGGVCLCVGATDPMIMFEEKKPSCHFVTFTSQAAVLQKNLVLQKF